MPTQLDGLTSRTLEAQQSPVQSPILNAEIPTPHISPKHSENPIVDEVIPESPVASHTVVLSEHNKSSSSSEDNVFVETPAPILVKEALVKKFIEQDASIPWEDTHRGEHASKADELLSNSDFKTQLKITSLSTKHLQGLHSQTQEKVDKLLEKADKLEMETKLDKKKFIRPISEKAQLNEIQTSVELLLSLLLSDDAKKGEKIVKSKCSDDQILKKTDDETDDQGNPSQGRGQAQSKQSSKVKLNSDASKSSTQKKTSSEAAQIESLIASIVIQNMRSSSDEQSLTKPDVLIQGMYLDNLKEEEARFKAEKTNLKPKASVAKKPPRPKEKGIVIKEKTISKASNPKTRSQFEIDLKWKGKEKVDEPTKFQKRKIPSVVIDPVYQTIIHDDDTLTEEDVQTMKRKKISEESKTTSDKAQVVQSEKKQAKPKAASSDKVKKSTSDSAQVDLDKIEVADKKKLLWINVKPSDPKKSQLLSDFMSIGLNAREPRDRAGLGSDEAKIKTGLEVATRDPFLLTDKPLEEVTQKHLNKVISVQVVLDAHDKHNIKENMILFLEDGRISDVRIRCTEQNSERTSILSLPFREFIPCIVEDDGSEIPMKKDSSKLEIGSLNEEMKQVKTTLSQVLRIKEEKLISHFVKNHYGFRLTQ
ncbi:hypothetical protein AgCh_028845 [Apium graveolens]